MKLYAKVKSERSEKGQGGNDFITTLLTVGDPDTSAAKRILYAHVSKRGTDYLLQVQVMGERAQEYWLDAKGEKQKGECNGKHQSVEDIVKCPDCSKALDRM